MKTTTSSSATVTDSRRQTTPARLGQPISANNQPYALSQPQTNRSNPWDWNECASVLASNTTLHHLVPVGPDTEAFIQDQSATQQPIHSPHSRSSVSFPSQSSIATRQVERYMIKKILENWSDKQNRMATTILPGGSSHFDSGAQFYPPNAYHDFNRK